MKKGMLIFLMLGSTLFAGIDVRTLIRNVELGGTSERAGLIQMVVNADDFAGASTANPYYIRYKLEKNAKLAETLVDIVGSPFGHDPIALPSKVEGDTENVAINVPPNGISIIRWREGETSFWVKVTSSSSAWILRQNLAEAPSSETRIAFTIGYTWQESTDHFQEEFDNQLANLVVPTRHGGAEVDAPINLDLSQSTLLPAPNPASLLHVDMIPFDGATNGVETSAAVTFGNLAFILISGDTEIARGMGLRQDRWIYHIPKWKNNFSCELTFNNRLPIPASMKLRPYNAQGEPLAEVMVDVDGQSLKTISAEILFGNSEVTHCQILGPESCALTVAYGLGPRPSLTAHVSESSKDYSYWELYPEKQRFGFDGLVLVNLGEQDATLTVTALDENGDAIGSETYFVDQPILPLGKKMLILQQMFPNFEDVKLFEFRGSQRLGVLALRGSLRGQSIQSLFAVQPITISLDD